jgi:hypothetical protein
MTLKFIQRTKMNLDSYNEVLDYLNEYFTLRVKDESYLRELRELVEGSRRQKTVTIRPMQILFWDYVKKYNDYNVATIEEEKELWRDLLGCWQ